MSEKVQSSPPLSGISPIREAPVMMPETWEAIEQLIEMPLRAAMHDLWEKGIISTESSANGEDALIGSVFFDILADSHLSSENKIIAIKLGAKLLEKRGQLVYEFRRNVKTDSTSEEIVRWSRLLAAKFQIQQKEVRT